MKGAASEQHKIITSLVLDGSTFTHLAKLYKLHPSRIRTIFWHTMRQIGHKKILNIIGHLPQHVSEWRKYSYAFKAMLRNMPTCEPGQRYKK